MAKRKARTIVVFSRKGGVGKTTVATTLAALLARKTPTILLDMDTQGSASLVLGCENSTGVANLLRGEEVDLPLVEGTRLHVAAGNAELDHASLARLELLKELPHRHLVFDVGSTVKPAEVLRAVQPDVALVISQPDPLASMMVAGAIALASAHAERVGVLTTAISEASWTKSIDELVDAFGLPTFGVHTEKSLLSAYHMKQKPLTMAPKSRICDDLEEVVRWL